MHDIINTTIFIGVGVYFISKKYSEYTKDKKNIKNIPKFKEDIKKLTNENKILQNEFNNISKNIILYRNYYEANRKRKSYFASKRKR